MNCVDFIIELERLDNKEMPQKMLNHMEKCPSCKLEAERLQKAMNLCKLPSACDGLDISLKIDALLPFMPCPRRVVSMRNWIGVGIFVILSMVLVPFIKNFQLLSDGIGVKYALTSVIVTGLTVSIYVTFFVISHMENLTKFAKAKHLV